MEQHRPSSSRCNKSIKCTAREKKVKASLLGQKIKEEKRRKGRLKTDKNTQAPPAIGVRCGATDRLVVQLNEQKKKKKKYQSSTRSAARTRITAP